MGAEVKSAPDSVIQALYDIVKLLLCNLFVALEINHHTFSLLLVTI